ncbi:RNase H family protein [Dechloromonas sp. HYN0024]|uniref:RNase H family protein n=1 Tax=Dechloromonas sp. HYN0024 TaxID=2231055 RepID=UPI000E42ED23|nr:RNase H family protein [Dechloromonas sp. HYN0024]AXS80012.1 hypothetical protein HYN24_08255 [Dechloromonas sp. HYN0024]
MPKRRKKKIVRVIHPSAGPLPARLTPLYVGQLLVFSDASQKRQGGLAAILFDDPDGEPLVESRSVPVTGSNELELQAALFAISEAGRHFPGRPFALFSDNQDAVIRLNRGKTEGLAQDPVLRGLVEASGLADSLKAATICWIKGHGSCRGNILADLHAAEAAR